MPRLEYFLVSEGVAVDAESNRISFFNVLEEIHPASAQSLVPNVVAVSAWLLEPEEMGTDFQARLSVRSPGAAERELAVNFRGQNRRHRIIHRIQGLPILAAGDLVFSIHLNANRAADHTVTVHPVPPAPPA